MPPSANDPLPVPPRGSAAARWDDAYRLGWAPWDIGRPQPAFVALADAREITGPVLDVGCGTGEQALMLAARGIAATGVDLAPSAIATARAKAAERQLEQHVDFRVADALELSAIGTVFASVVDSGVFHTFSDADRPRYVASLASALRPGGVLHLLCFSEMTPGDAGPRRVTREELHAAFADGWTVEWIEGTRFDVADGFATERPYAWLARIVRG
jgi:cyclopropane fatty-acyl-phospholipid synthase-like methyltransferase